MTRVSEISRRPLTEADLEFSFVVYASTRKEEMDLVSFWTDEQKQLFLEQQFQAQHTYYQQQYPEGEFLILLEQDRPIGRLYLHSGDEEIRIIDIALLPEHCGRGIGTMLLQEILADGAATGKKVSIHVMQNNRALRLYERLGFQQAGEVGVYWFLQWSPEGGATAS